MWAGRVITSNYLFKLSHVFPKLTNKPKPTELDQNPANVGVIKVADLDCEHLRGHKIKRKCAGRYRKMTSEYG